MAKNELKTASVLAFERVLDISDGFFGKKTARKKIQIAPSLASKKNRCVAQSAIA